MLLKSLFSLLFLNSVSVSWACTDSLCIGDNVIYSATDKKAQIIGTFQNDFFAIQYEDTQIVSPISKTPLAVTFGCAYGLCIGDRVAYSQSDMLAKVVGIFKNGSFAIQHNSGVIVSPISINQLALINGGKNFREVCISANGRIQFVTDLGTKENRSVELIVDGESYGAGLLRNEISESVEDFVTKHFELDHERTLWASTIRNRDGSVTLLDGLNPATGKAMGVQHRLTCTKVEML